MKSFDSNKAEYTRIRNETRATYKGELNGTELMVGTHPDHGSVRLLKLAGEPPHHDYYHVELERGAPSDKDARDPFKASTSSDLRDTIRGTLDAFK